MKKYIFLFCSLVFMGSCSEDDNNGPKRILSPNYIVQYMKADFQTIIVTDRWLIQPVPASVKRRRSYELGARGWVLDEFNQIAERNGDTHYNDYVITGPLFSNWAYADNFEEIHFVSDTDWNPDYPAGSSLDDIVMVEFYSFAPFVDNGYQPFRFIDQEMDGVTIQKLASELTADDMRMIKDETWCFWLDRMPDRLLEHTLTITLVTVDGETLTITGKGYPRFRYK